MSERITVHYDEIPKEDLPALRKELQAGTARVEFDYDRVGWSKTGWVYRIIRRVS